MSTAASSGVSLPVGAGRAFNFSAGPGVLPEDVLNQAREDMLDLFGTGVGILEHSHRGAAYDRVLEEAIADARALASIPDDYEVMFVQGGATTQCFQAPMAFLPEAGTADYMETGKWAKDSIHEAKRYGTVHTAFSGAESNYSELPQAGDDRLSYSDNPAYVHFTSNNTIMGTEWHELPKRPDNGAWFLCDASSDIFSRPIDVTEYGFIYAGGQKNLGPAGTVFIIARKDVLEKQVRELPWMLDYQLIAKKQSRFNTPPTFGVYLIGQTFKWIMANGGLEGMRAHNEQKAKIVYDVLDASSFYTPHARKQDRSLMNITFKTPSEELDKRFVEAGEEQGLRYLGGHRSIGGMRASMYNAMPIAGAEALASFMKEFERTHG